MKLMRFLAVSVLAVCLSGVAYVGQRNESSALKMARAGEKFLDSLGEDQRTKAVFAFDDAERYRWYFTPQQRGRKSTRKGLPLEEMTEPQRKAALALLESGTSADGNKKATTIMSLEAILHDLEKGGAMVRNPGWYFFSIFGKPASTGRWGWRVEGHHLSLNFTLDGDKVVSSTPTFFGANPATVMQGARKGLRTLPEAEDLAKELFKSFDEDQKKVAHRDREFPEIVEGSSGPKVGQPEGLAAAKMNESQQTLLMKLLRAYSDRMPADVGGAEMAKVKDAGLDKIHFAFAGGLSAGQPHSYRVQGPTFLVEFVNVQPDSAKNPANHIHSAWRTIEGDFGLAAR